MIRELLEQRADLAIADLTITFEREQVSVSNWYNLLLHSVLQYFYPQITT